MFARVRLLVEVAKCQMTMEDEEKAYHATKPEMERKSDMVARQIQTFLLPFRVRFVI